MDHLNPDSTRYLCAAVHTDFEFREQVIKLVYDESNRSKPVAAGIDLYAVAKHAINAKRRKLIRNVVLTVLLIPWIQAVIANSSFPPLEISTLLLIFAWTIVYIEELLTRRILGKYLTKKRYNPHALALPLKIDQDIKSRLGAELSRSHDSNVVVYSGFSPFVGSGLEIGGWSFALDLSKGKESALGDLIPETFDVSEIYKMITNSINNLKFSGLVVEDKVFINGTQIRDDERFLSSRFAKPKTKVDQNIINQIMQDNLSSARYYKAINLNAWQGDIVLTIFLRFLKLPSNLFVESSYFILPPIKDKYRNIDSFNDNFNAKRSFKLFLRSFCKSIIVYPLAPIFVFQHISTPFLMWNERKEYRKQIMENQLFDYGASKSLREIIASEKFKNYFQRLDRDMYIKSIEGKILNTIVEFLDSKNIDTSELKSRQNTILNHGVIVNGGSVEAQNLTVGGRAKSVVNNLSNVMPHAASFQIASSNK